MASTGFFWFLVCVQWTAGNFDRVLSQVDIVHSYATSTMTNAGLKLVARRTSLSPQKAFGESYVKNFSSLSKN
jgi:hypothetical protein